MAGVSTPPAAPAPTPATPSSAPALSRATDFLRNHTRTIVIGVLVVALGGTAIGVTKCNNEPTTGNDQSKQQVQKSDKFLTITNPASGGSEWSTNFDVRPGTHPVRGTDNRVIVIGSDGKPLYCTRESLVTTQDGTRRETALCFEAIEGTSNMRTIPYPDPRATQSGTTNP